MKLTQREHDYIRAVIERYYLEDMVPNRDQIALDIALLVAMIFRYVEDPDYPIPPHVS